MTSSLGPAGTRFSAVRNLAEVEGQGDAPPIALGAAAACQQQHQEMMEGTRGRARYAESILRVAVHFRGIQERSQTRYFMVFSFF